jgi:predicted HicB family RNase H-like nuclease
MQYNRSMKPKTEILQIRISDSEKEGFELAAALAGISLSSWVRERLRLTAIRELEGAGRRVPFVPEISMGGTNARG